MELDLHFYKTHPLFKVTTAEMLEDEIFQKAVEEQTNNNKKWTFKNDQKILEQETFFEKNKEELSGDFRKMFEDATPSENLPPMEPGELMKTDLLLHQKIGLRWMVMKESSRKDKSLFWKKVETGDGFSFWKNEITGAKMSKVPEEFKGGILADEV